MKLKTNVKKDYQYVIRFFPVLGAKNSNAEFQYPSGQWLELCGQMAVLVGDSGNNKG